jgi:anti-sigma B factor antagonist
MNNKTKNNLDFEWETRSGFLVIQVNARRATVDMAPKIKERLSTEIENGINQIIIDFSYVEFVDSSFLGALVAGLKMAKSKEGEIKISGLHPHVRITFELTRLDHLFKIYNSIEQAMRDA